MYKLSLLLILMTVAFLGCQRPDETTRSDQPVNWNDEIIYHVMPRSFYDANGDLHGDLNGFVQKLDYLKELGVTAILFTPLYESEFYHNYFPTNYENIDPEYGTKEDYLNFVKAVHEKGLKFLMDMETQYAQSGNVWFDDSYRNPSSSYSDFIYYTDSLNEYPEQIFMASKSPLYEFAAWPEKETHNIVCLDMNNPVVKQWMTDFYVYWVDPNGDGDFEDGVDGFRIDHIMDDLDHKGVFTNLYTDFWQPIFQKCRALNPDLFIVGEQANWNEYGDEMIRKSGANGAFNFPLRFALAGEENTGDMFKDPTASGVKMDPARIHQVVQESMKRFGDSTFTINFLENHDTDRWASVVNKKGGQMRMAAVLNLLLPGVPAIYYGQELGVTGQVGDWGSDVNHIPVREGFPWTSNAGDPGNAIFYKNTGVWWDSSFWNTESIRELALTAQREDSSSLWNHYRELIRIRKDYPAFRQGSYEPVQTGTDQVLGFRRELGEKAVMAFINLSDSSIQFIPEVLKNSKMKLIVGDVTSADSLRLEPYQYVVFEL